MIRMVLITLLLAGGTAIVTYVAQNWARRLLTPKPWRKVRPIKECLPEDWNPWKIADDAPELKSPDGTKHVYYNALQEMQQGSPLRGECIVRLDEGEVRIGNACACPPVWSACSRYVALPLWTPDMRQHLGVLDTETLTMRVSKEQFSVLYLQSLADDFITGVDTPTGDARKLCSSLQNMPWQEVLQLEKRAS